MHPGSLALIVNLTVYSAPQWTILVVLSIYLNYFYYPISLTNKSLKNYTAHAHNILYSQILLEFLTNINWHIMYKQILSTVRIVFMLPFKFQLIWIYR